MSVIETHALVREIIAQRGEAGISVAYLREELASRDYFPARETLQHWLTEDTRAGLITTDGSSRYTIKAAPKIAILRWDKPPPLRPHSDHERFYGGCYVPNMAEADARSWKAKLSGQRSENLKDLRVEIRKTVGGTGYDLVQVKLVVYADSVYLSMNGTAGFTPSEFRELQRARDEAHQVLDDARAVLAKAAAV